MAGGANAFPNVEEQARVAVGATRGCKSPWAGKGDDEKEPGLISLAEEKFWFIIIPPDGQQTLDGSATGVGRTQSLARFIIIIIINFFSYVSMSYESLSHTS